MAVSGATTGRDFYSGIQLVISAMLQSPHFLYQVELGAEEAPDSGPDSGAAYPRMRG